MHLHLSIDLLLLFLLPSLLLATVGHQNTWAVELIQPSHARHVAASHGCQLLSQMRLMNAHYALLRCGSQSFDNPKKTHRIRRHASVLWAEQQVAKVRVKRSAVPPSFNDPHYPQQWYLKSGATGGHDLSVAAVWSQGLTGRGSVVSILDDGIEHTHPDLKDNYDPLASTDINGADSDPMPRATFNNENRHGTRCAGEVAAKANNHICSVGIAYNAKIGGVRMLDGPITDHAEASSLHFNQHHVDIYSASWGPDDDGRTVDGPGRLAKAAFEEGVTKGRGGLGNIFVWASGNGGQKSDSCGCDGYTNSIYTLSVSSVTQHNLKPWYLEECASTLASTYSSGTIGDAQVVSTDLNGQCTSTHTGTSASAPIAAAILALVLEANRNVTWRDAQHITVLGADSSFLTDADWLSNQAGLKSSRKYGFGMMSADRMVMLAKMWARPVPPLVRCPGQAVIVNRSVPPSGPLTVPVVSDGCGGTVGMLESVQLHVDMTFTNRGQLQVSLVSPGGTRSLLLAPRKLDGNNGDCGFQKWPFMSVQFWRERPAGQWQVVIENTGSPANSGTVKSVTLVLHGTAGEPISLRRIQPPLPDWLAPYSHTMGAGYLCHADCRTCAGPGQANCTGCQSGRLLLQDERTCYLGSTCPTGYSQSTDDGVNRCIPCRLANCSNCLTANSCHACLPGSGLLAAGPLGCLSQCPDGSYPDTLAGRCRPCYSANCSRCDRPRQCSRCKPGHLLLSGIDCPTSCPASGFYADSAGRACLPCPDRCDRCNGPSLKTQCQACRPPLVAAAISGGSVGSCVDLSPTPNPTTSALACDPPISGCLSCLSNTTGAACATCLSGFSLHQGRCVSACPAGLRSCPLLVGGGGSTVCVPCSNCSQAVCASLPSPLCGIGSYPASIDAASTTADCRSCHPSCRSCSSGGGPDKCLTCRRGIACLLAGRCLRCCPAGVPASLAVNADSFFKSMMPNDCVQCRPGYDSCPTAGSDNSTKLPTDDSGSDINADLTANAQRVLYALLCIATVVVIVCLFAYCMCASASSSHGSDMYSSGRSCTARDARKLTTASYSRLDQQEFSPDRELPAFTNGFSTKL
ncbi:hypothetical protein BOX15_Mlig004879g1 [Macrostomum lignano]|uniref:P/Homo B domain-containing protein n=2 Tax=Macrostomum lignano TaxID=282301 RepID=A0A267G3Z7_9PLAT|nr:hypothetical protein BOX15_Mlig004879g1 [Macrostomum lignano]